MKTRFVATALIAATAACAGVALAGPYQQVPYEPQPRPEVYIFGYGGVSWLNELEANSVPGFALEISGEDGFAVGGGVGLRFPHFLGGSRWEVEGYYRGNDSDGVRPSFPAFGGGGDVSLSGVMTNFIKEFAWNGVVPYIGIGVGFNQTEVDVTFPGPGGISDNETSFAWQAIAGLEFPFWQRVSLYTEYHYISVSDFTMNATTAFGARLMDFGEFSNHSVVGGIRIYF